MKYGQTPTFERPLVNNNYLCYLMLKITLIVVTLLEQSKNMKILSEVTP